MPKKATIQMKDSDSHGVRRQSAATTELLAASAKSKAASRFSCRRTPKSALAVFRRGRARHFQTSLPMPVEAGPKVELKSWAVIYWGPIVDGRWAIIRAVSRVSINWRFERRVGRRRVIHVEINPLRDVVLRGKEPPGPKDPDLGELICRQGKGTDNVIIRAEIVEGSVFVPKDFQMRGADAHVLAVGIDVRAGW